MKVCCDRCEKAIEQGLFGKYIGGEILTKHNEYFPNTTIVLCDNCYKEFNKFLEGGGTDE